MHKSAKTAVQTCTYHLAVEWPWSHKPEAPSVHVTFVLKRKTPQRWALVSDLPDSNQVCSQTRDTSLSALVIPSPRKLGGWPGRQWARVPHSLSYTVWSSQTSFQFKEVWKVRWRFKNNEKHLQSFATSVVCIPSRCLSHWTTGASFQSQTCRMNEWMNERHEGNHTHYLTLSFEPKHLYRLAAYPWPWVAPFFQVRAQQSCAKTNIIPVLILNQLSLWLVSLFSVSSHIISRCLIEWSLGPSLIYFIIEVLTPLHSFPHEPPSSKYLAFPSSTL